MPEKDAVPGAVIAIQTLGDFLGFNPTATFFARMAVFTAMACSGLHRHSSSNTWETIFRHKAYEMLLSKGKITQDTVAMLMSWRHSGFNVFCGPKIHPRQEQAMENLARYIIRASFSQERMTYIKEESKVVYESKDGKAQKVFDALE